jgi:dihydrofolate reductase
MRRLIYSATVSLDGYIADRDGGIAWSAPDDELFRFHTERVAALGAILLGRRLYETMSYWDGPAPDADPSPDHREFAAIWRALPKLVFSTTLQEVGPSATLLRGDPAGALARLRADEGGDIEVGGAGLAAEYALAGLVDEYRLFVTPIVLGGGTPFFPAPQDPIALELLETRAFGAGVVYLRYGSTSPR